MLRDHQIQRKITAAEEIRSAALRNVEVRSSWRDIKLFHRVSEQPDKCFPEQGVLPFVRCPPTGQTTPWFIHLHRLKQLHYSGHNKNTQRRNENLPGCLWVTKESNNFPLHPSSDQGGFMLWRAAGWGGVLVEGGGPGPGRDADYG